MESERAVDNSSSVILQVIWKCVSVILYTHITTFTMRQFYSKYLDVDAGILFPSRLVIFMTHGELCHSRW